jgi:hypothetical protein
MGKAVVEKDWAMFKAELLALGDAFAAHKSCA